MPTTQIPIRVLCVDDHSFLVDGLANRINLEQDMTCVGCLPTADNLPDHATRLKPDVVTLDLEMPGADPLEMVGQLKRSFETIRIIVLTAHLRDHYIDQALMHGADGFFSKNDPPSLIIDGIRQVVDNRTAFGQEVQKRLQQSKQNEAGDQPHVNSRLHELSPREIEVLRFIGKGLSRADIARQLFRSLKTIDAHHTSIMRKLDIHDRAELTRYAIREGLTEA